LGTRCTLLRPGTLEYQDAWQLQRRIADDVRGGGDPALILLEHPPTYTLGARGNTQHLLLTREAYARRGAAVVQSDRGGDVTFHGPGQIVGYPIINLRARGEGPLWYVHALEEALIDTLRGYGIEAGRREGARGAWCGDAKVAAIGVRVSRGVTMHGFALNVNTDLSWFGDIVACGLRDASVTSMQAIAGETFDIADVQADVARAFGRQFGLEMVDDAARLASALASDDAVSLDGAVVARAESPRYGTLDGDDGVTARAESPRYGRFQGKSSSREAEVGS
jgi:lipoate-protein ligase B